MVTRFWSIHYWSAIGHKVYLGNYVMAACHCSKEITFQCKRNRKCVFDPQVGNILWSRKWQLTQHSCLENIQGQRSLAGHSPWGCKESDMTEHHNTHTHTNVGRIVYEDQYQWDKFCVQWTGLQCRRHKETCVLSLGRKDPLEEGTDNPLQYSCVENLLDRGAQWAIVHMVAKS